MKITRRKLSQIIKETLALEQMKVSPYGSSANTGQASIDALHAGLAAASLIDPTMATDLADAFIYSLEGDHDSAALVIVASAGGLAAGAAVAKLAKARAVAKAKKQEGKMTDEAFTAYSKSIDKAVADIEGGIPAKAPPKKPGQSHYVNPGRGQRVTSSGQLAKAEPGTPRGQGGSRGGRSDPRASMRFPAPSGGIFTSAGRLLDGDQAKYVHRRGWIDQARNQPGFKVPETGTFNENNGVVIAIDSAGDAHMFIQGTGLGQGQAKTVRNALENLRSLGYTRDSFYIPMSDYHLRRENKVRITKTKLQQIIKEELARLNERSIKVTADSESVDISKLTKRFDQERNIKPESGESLEFKVTKDGVTGPDGREKETKLVDNVRKPLAAYDHIPDDVTVTVTYSN